MTKSIFDQILLATQETVTVAGFTFQIREPSLEEIQQANKDTDDNQEAFFRLMAICVLGENGEPAFTLAQTKALPSSVGKALTDVLSRKMQALNDDGEEGNSLDESTPATSNG